MIFSAEFTPFRSYVSSKVAWFGRCARSFVRAPLVRCFAIASICLPMSINVISIMPVIKPPVYRNSRDRKESACNKKKGIRTHDLRVQVVFVQHCGGCSSTIERSQSIKIGGGGPCRDEEAHSHVQMLQTLKCVDVKLPTREKLNRCCKRNKKNGMIRYLTNISSLQRHRSTGGMDFEYIRRDC